MSIAYATERLLAAAREALNALSPPNNDEEREAADELESALHYFDAHGDKPEGGFQCQACGRDEAQCSASPCEAVEKDRAQ